MRTKAMMGKHRCFGSMTVGPRGQVVIPANARRELGINTGDTILVFQALMGQQGLLLLKADTVEQMLSMMSEGVAQLEKLVKEHTTKAAKVEKGA
jgi:AbrB family looped-hinge helix DNA binding protein